MTQVRTLNPQDSVLLDTDMNLKRCSCGNETIWRSPDLWTRAKQDLPSYGYSFRIMAIYVMVGEMVLA